MRRKSLMRKSLTQFIVCTTLLMMLATPLFYLLTKDFYAEDMIDIIDAVRQGQPVPAIDMEEDIVHGLVLQFVLIAAVLGVALVLVVRYLSGRLWRPFDATLQAMEGFRLEDGRLPVLTESGVEEFDRLNAALGKLMSDSLDSYHTQREFTENASHELQTPLAVFQSKLDMLLQQPGLTAEQAAIVQDLYRMCGRLSRLNRNLLLLAKMDNRQFGRETTDVVAVVDELQSYFDNLTGNLTLHRDFGVEKLTVQANPALLESLVSNLVVNAIRHNRPDGSITIGLSADRLTVANTSDEAPLDGQLIFNRFYRPSERTAGNGLGLAIVKAVCDYHGWHVDYRYDDGQHCFTVTFG